MPELPEVEVLRRSLEPHLLGERFDICRAVAHYKSAHGIPMMQPDRVAAVRARYLARGAAVEYVPLTFPELRVDGAALDADDVGPRPACYRP